MIKCARMALLLLICLEAQAKELSTTLTFTYKGAKISESPLCHASADHCLARKWVDQGIVIGEQQKLPFPAGGGNPSAHICLYLKGAPGHLVGEKGENQSICRFEDQSFIYSWDLLKLLKN